MREDGASKVLCSRALRTLPMRLRKANFLSMKKWNIILVVATVMITALGVNVPLQAQSATARVNFRDSRREHWGYEAVNTICQAGLIEGLPDDTFGGDKLLTRYEFAAAIARLSLRMSYSYTSPGALPSGAGSVGYADVPAGHWAFHAVESITRGAIVEGFPDGGYHGSQPTTRYACALAIARLIGAPFEDTGQLRQTPEMGRAEYPDVPATHWAFNVVSFVSAAGLIEGYADGTFRGDQAMTRHQFAVMLARLIYR